MPLETKYFEFFYSVGVGTAYLMKMLARRHPCILIVRCKPITTSQYTRLLRFIVGDTKLNLTQEYFVSLHRLHQYPKNILHFIWNFFIAYLIRWV